MRGVIEVGGLALCVRQPGSDEARVVFIWPDGCRDLTYSIAPWPSMGTAHDRPVGRTRWPLNLIWIARWDVVIAEFALVVVGYLGTGPASRRSPTRRATLLQEPREVLRGW